MASHLADETDAGEVGVVVRSFPAEQRRDGDDGRDGPAGDDHGEDPAHRSVVDVVDPCHRPVAVQRDRNLQ